MGKVEREKTYEDIIDLGCINPTEISISSKLSVLMDAKSNAYYSFEYCEKVQIDMDAMIDQEISLEKVKELLWAKCHGQVDKQYEETKEMFKK